MTLFDLAVIATVVASMLVGWWRGLVYEAVTLLGWVTAYLVARLVAPDLVGYLPPDVGSETTRMALAFSAIFLVTLVLGSILAWGLSHVVKSSELASLDGSLGALFGMLRGLVLVVVLVLVAGMTELPKQDLWREALMSGMLEKIAVETKALLPDGLAQKIRYQG